MSSAPTRLPSGALALAALAGCSNSGATVAALPNGSRAAIRITGSDTMINLRQAFAEKYRDVNPGVSVQVAGGGSGVGIAGLIDGILEVAAAGLEMTPTNDRPRARTGEDPRQRRYQRVCRERPTSALRRSSGWRDNQQRP